MKYLIQSGVRLYFVTVFLINKCSHLTPSRPEVMYQRNFTSTALVPCIVDREQVTFTSLNPAKYQMQTVTHSLIS